MTNKTGVGIVALPMIFGPSRSFVAHVEDLRVRGYTVAVASLYPHHAPFFLCFVAGPEQGAAKRRNRLAASIDQDAVVGRITGAANSLRSRGCHTIILMGFGFGGIMALKAAAPARAEGVIAWYPHLVPPGGSSLELPDLQKLRCQALVLFGDKEEETPESLELAREIAAHEPRLRVSTFSGAGHAFADRNVQGHIRSPKFNRLAEENSWAVAMRWLHGQIGQ